MTTDFEYRSGDQAAPRSIAQVPLLLGTCADGDAGTSYTFDAGDDVEANLGPGKVTALAIAHGQIGRCVVAPVAATYPALPAVTKTGTGPDVSIALIGSTGPHDDAPMKLTVTADAKRVDVSYDGVATAETILIPPEGPAVLRGKVDISGNDIVVNGKHLDITEPEAKVIGFAADAAGATSAGLHAALATTVAPAILTSDDLIAAGVAELDKYPRNLTFTTAGVTASDAPASVTVTGLDASGAAQSETITLSQTAATASGTKAFRGSGLTITYAAADGTGATIAIGWGSVFGPSTPAEMVTRFNARAVSQSSTVRARVYEESTGEQYLELYTTGTGEGVTMTIDAAASDVDDELGFTNVSPANLTATGVPGTYDFEWLGVRATFEAGDYKAGTSYVIPLRGPRGAVGDYVDALTEAVGDYQAHPFGFVVVCEDPATNANARALYDALRAIANTKRHDPDDPVLFDVVTPTALHAASAVKATNDAAITSWESDLATALNGAAKSLESIAIADGYIAGPPKMPGTFRRPATWAAGFKRASLNRIAGNPCDGAVPGVSLIGADGARARDEAKRATKLSGLAGPGFWALKSTQDGDTKFAPSASRAGALDRYRNPGAVAFALEASRAMLPTLQKWEGTWPTDEENPKAADPVFLEHRTGILTALVDPVAFPANEPKNVAAFTIKLIAPQIADDGNATVYLDFNPLAVGEKVRAILTATGVTLETPGA